MTKDQKRRLGWRTELKFQIGLHVKDLNLLHLLQEYLQGVGFINLSYKRDLVNYSINSLHGWNVLIAHLDMHPLRTQKQGDYLLFKQALRLVKEKYHLTSEGLNEIINIKTSMNLGLSEVIKAEFPQNVPTLCLPYRVRRGSKKTSSLR